MRVSNGIEELPSRPTIFVQPVGPYPCCGEIRLGNWSQGACPLKSVAAIMLCKKRTYEEIKNPRFLSTCGRFLKPRLTWH